MFYNILLTCVLKFSFIHSVYLDLLSPTCASGWTIYNNAFCHKVVVTPTNAFVAQQVCRSLGGYLADPTDIVEWSCSIGVEYLGCTKCLGSQICIKIMYKSAPCFWHNLCIINSFLQFQFLFQ